MKTALYVRVSTEDQATNGVSLKAQEERLRAYCLAREWTVTEVYRDDGYSAKSLERPALRRLLDAANSKRFDAVLVFKLDRLTRSVRDLGTLLELLEKRRIALVSLTESLDASTAAGRLMMHLLGSVSQWEREAIGERTKLALHHKRQHGQVYGKEPYGFKRAGDELRPLERELRVVRRIYAMRRDRATLREIAEILNGDNIPTKTGKRWAAETIRYILRNALYGPHVERGA
jgi:site-specific DNA recombinase